MPEKRHLLLEEMPVLSGESSGIGDYDMKQSQVEDIIGNIILVGACVAHEEWVRIFLCGLCFGQFILVILHRNKENREKDQQ